ncbi:MAG: LytTR family DNA-binding domain-containing protein [Bacteroidales bacterium]
MNILIVEDEKLAAGKLASMLTEIDPTLRIAGQTGSIRESVQWLMQNRADLIFLDIQLSDGLSFSIFEQVQVATPVIFTTAFDQYAIQAFQLNSVAYLLKPIRKRDLEESLKKFDQLKSAFRIDFESLLAQVQGTAPAYKKRFLIQIGQKIKRIESPDVAYFYVRDKSCFLCTRSGSSYPVEYTLDGLQSLTDPARFFRINRKYLVSLESIAHMTAYSRGRIKLTLDPPAADEFDTIVSIDRSSGVKDWMNQ